MSERFGNEMAQLKLLLCQELLQCDCEKTPKIPRNFLIERPRSLSYMPTVVNFGYMVLVMEAQMWMDWSDRAVPNVYHLPEYTKVCMGQPSFLLGSASQMINFCDHILYFKHQNYFQYINRCWTFSLAYGMRTGVTLSDSCDYPVSFYSSRNRLQIHLKPR